MKAKPPAIVMLTPGFPDSETDYNCLPAIQSFVRSFKMAHPQLTVFVLSFQYPFTAGAYQWQDCEVIAFGGQNKPRLQRLRIWWKVWTTMRRLHKRYKINALLSFWLGEAALLGQRFGKRYAIPYYCWMQGQDAKADNDYVQRIRPNPKSLIAISDFIADTLYQQHRLRAAYTIPIGVLANGQTTTDQYRKIDIIAAGSLIPLKQYDILLDVLKKILTTRHTLTARLCGDGPELNALHEKATHLQLNDHLLITGELPHGVLLRMMEQSKVLLHTSSYEGFSTVCLEALAAGAMVISFHQPTHSVIPNWFVVDSPEAMAAKAIELLNVTDHDYRSTIPYPMAETIKQLSGLLLQEEA